MKTYRNFWMSLAYLKRTSCRSVLTGLAVLMILYLPACHPVFSHPSLFTRPHPVFRRAEKQNPHKHLLHCLYCKPIYGCLAAGMDFGKFLSFLRENSMFFRKVPQRFFLVGGYREIEAFVCLHIYSHPQSSIYPLMLSKIFIIKLYCASFSHW